MAMMLSVSVHASTAEDSKSEFASRECQTTPSMDSIPPGPSLGYLNASDRGRSEYQRQFAKDAD